MQFRDRSKLIQVIRTVYDPAIKRGRSVVVGRMDKDNPSIGADLLDALSEEELGEVQEFILNRTQRVSTENTECAAAGLAAQMRMAESWFRSGAKAGQGAVAAEIYGAWADLKKAMHRAGFKKPKD